EQLPALRQRPQRISLRQPAGDRLELERGAAGRGESLRPGKRQKALDDLQGGRVAVGLEVEVGKQLELGGIGERLTAGAYRQALLQVRNANAVVARHHDSPL